MIMNIDNKFIKFLIKFFICFGLNIFGSGILGIFFICMEIFVGISGSFGNDVNWKFGIGFVVELLKYMFNELIIF